MGYQLLGGLGDANELFVVSSNEVWVHPMDGRNGYMRRVGDRFLGQGEGSLQCTSHWSIARPRGVGHA